MSRKRDVRAMIIVLVVVLAGLIFGSPTPADAMVPEDLLSMRTVGLLGVSPDGDYLLYSLAVWDEAARANKSTLYRRDLVTGKDQLLFTPEENSSGPVIRHDGAAIAYLRAGDEGTEVWLMDNMGGDRVRLSNGAGNFGALHWAPDGTALAWVASGKAGDYEGDPGHYVVADNIGFRHLGEGYREGSLRQLFVMDLANGDVRRLVNGDLDVRSLSWSPDSRQLVFSAKRRADLGLNLNNDLWRVARLGGQPVQLTTNPGDDRDPQWHAPDSIAYLRATEPLWETAPNAVAELNPAQGEAGGLKLHGEDFDNYFWKYTMSDGVPYILGSRRGCLDLVRLGRSGPEFLTDGGHDYWSFHIVNRQVYLQGVGQTLPGAIMQVDLAEKIKGPHRPRILIDPNRDWRQKVGLVEPEPFTVTVEGRVVEGWYFKPDHLEEGRPVPTVLSIHGGPQWMYGGYFLPEFHILTQFGYGVVICNPTGSMGYGIKFMSEVRGDWTGRPAREVLAALDQAVAEGWADPNRLAVIGGSYGGHLGAALTTQTDRFKAAALDRMFPETISFWGTTDEKWVPEWEFMGRPWEPEAREVYLRNSPYEEVASVTTPTLISQGMRDYRCLVAGGEMWFSALQSLGVPSRLIRFEDEGHGVRNPANLVFYHNQMLNWFDTHVLGPIEPEGVSGLHD
ncbi:MAG: S9 family peptidase [Candidatus Krumholzibacteria bacterium]|nr:S9 family peptidase [Candidatus Krumholzibacteria bacterium]